MLKMFDALLPYYGGKRKLCPVIFGVIHDYYPREKWADAVFVDAFLGSGAVSLYAKAQGLKVICNDCAERAHIAGKALIENNQTMLTESDIYRLFMPSQENKHLIEKECVPDVFTERHAKFLDNAFPNATRYIDRYLLLKYVFHLRPYSKFSSPNAFNRPMAEERYDEIKSTYTNHIKDNLKTPLEILKTEADLINNGIFSNGYVNEIHKKDVVEFIDTISGDILYLDPPYASTLSYENEYSVLDKILGDEKSKSKFSGEDGGVLPDRDVLTNELESEGVIVGESKYTFEGEEYLTFSFDKDKEDFSFDGLSKTDIQIADDVLEQLKGYGAKALTDITYKTAPMKKLGATQGGDEHLNEVLDLSCD